MFGPLLEVEMSKKCTLLWREAHFQVKRVKKTEGSWAFFDVQISNKCTLTTLTTLTHLTNLTYLTNLPNLINTTNLTT